MSRGRVRWLVLVPIGLIVAASMMFVQKHRHERAEAQAAAEAPAPASPPRADALRAEQPGAAFQRGMAELEQRRPRPALAVFNAIRDEPLRLAGQAMAQHDMRHAAESQLALETLLAHHGDIAAYQIAQVYAWRGQPEEAFQWLDRALVQRDGGLPDVKYDPAFRSLRTDERFGALLDKLGLPR
jgi:tetratricopeptide (TPR) repeat protein